MSTLPIQIVRFADRSLTDAVLRLEVSPRELIEAEREWGPFRRSAARELLHGGVPTDQIPRHWHWDWAAKAQNLRLLAYRCFGIECEDQMQGLMMVLAQGRQSRFMSDNGLPLVYVDYLESAPWNVIPLVETPRFAGIGVILIRAAVRLSLENGFEGRIGLHSLPQAADFYRAKCGMAGGERDEAYEGLPYFEMTRERAAEFLKT